MDELLIGDRVTFIDEETRLRFENGGEFYLESFGTRTEDNAPIARIVDRKTGVYSFAPLAWLKRVPSPTADELQARAKNQMVDPMAASSTIYYDTRRWLKEIESGSEIWDRNKLRLITVTVPVTPTTDSHLTCVLCGDGNVSHEFSARVKGRRSFSGIHEECARGIVGGGVADPP